MSVPNSAVYGFIPQSLCLTVALPVNRPSSPAASSKLIGWRSPASSSSPSTLPPSTEVDRNSIGVPTRTSSSIVCAMPALASSSSAWMPPVPSSTRSERESAVSVSAGSASGSSVADHEVTSISRSCPALDAAPVRFVLTVRVALSGPNTRAMDAP